MFNYFSSLFLMLVVIDMDMMVWSAYWVVYGYDCLESDPIFWTRFFFFVCFPLYLW